MDNYPISAYPITCTTTTTTDSAFIQISVTGALDADVAMAAAEGHLQAIPHTRGARIIAVIRDFQGNYSVTAEHP